MILEPFISPARVLHKNGIRQTFHLLYCIFFCHKSYLCTFWASNLHTILLLSDKKPHLWAYLIKKTPLLSLFENSFLKANFKSILSLFHGSLCLIYAFSGLLCLFKVYLRPFQPFYKPLYPKKMGSEKSSIFKTFWDPCVTGSYLWTIQNLLLAPTAK